MPSVPNAGSRSSSERSQGRYVLVVDDEPLVHIALRFILESIGFCALEAADSKAAADLCRQHADEIAAVVLDLSLPGIGGEQIFRELRTIRENVPVILSSGYHESDEVNRLLSEHAVTFLPKPYTSKELERSLTLLSS